MWRVVTRRPKQNLLPTSLERQGTAAGRRVMVRTPGFYDARTLVRLSRYSAYHSNHYSSTGSHISAVSSIFNQINVVCPRVLLLSKNRGGTRTCVLKRQCEVFAAPTGLG